MRLQIEAKTFLASDCALLLTNETVKKTLFTTMIVRIAFTDGGLLLTGGIHSGNITIITPRLTWNCIHLANANKIGHIRRINMRLGLFTPELITLEQLFMEESS